MFVCMFIEQVPAAESLVEATKDTNQNFFCMSMLHSLLFVLRAIKGGCYRSPQHVSITYIVWDPLLGILAPLLGSDRIE